MVWLHLGRLLGAVALIGGLPMIMMLVAARGPFQIRLLLAVAGCLIAALWLVVRCDRALRRKQEHDVARMEALGQEFSHAQLVVGVHWFRWLLAVVVLAGLGVLAVVFGTAYRSKDPVFGVAIVVVVLLLLASALWAYALKAVRAVRCGFALCVDERGFHVAGECFVPWSKFQDASVKHDYWLQLMVDPVVAEPLQGRVGEWPWQLGRPVVAANGRIIQVPLRMLSASPRFLEGAVYALCKRYAPPEFWERNASARQERELEVMQRRLKKLDSIRLADVLKLPVAKQAEFLQAGLDAVDGPLSPERATQP